MSEYLLSARILHRDSDSGFVEEIVGVTIDVLRQRPYRSSRLTELVSKESGSK